MDWSKIFTVEIPLFLNCLNILFLLGGKNRNPINHRYNRIFNPDFYPWIYISISYILAIVGIYLRDINIALYYACPLFLILCLFAFNKVIKIFYKRNIIIVIRGDFKPKKTSFLDTFLDF
jgi:cytochrome b subunit of formate dehydrogenase